MGRPSIQTTAMVDEIMERVANGEPLRQILRDPGMPHWTTFYDWLEGDATLSLRFARARETGYDVIAQDALKIADEPAPLTAQGSTDGGAVQHAKLRIETRLKLLAKWDPKRYGDRVELAGDAKAPLTVQIVRVGDDQGKGNG